MNYILATSILASALLATASNAEPITPAGKSATSAVAVQGVTGGVALPVTGTFTASLGGFTPSASGARMTPLSVGLTDSTATLPSGAVVVVNNVGTTNPMYCNVNGVASTTSDQLISANSWFAFTIPGSVTTLHCIATGGTTTANGLGGAGLPTGAGGGGGSGGGGGNVTIVGPLGTNAIAASVAVTPATSSSFTVAQATASNLNANVSQATAANLNVTAVAGTASLWGLLTQGSTTSGELGQLMMGAVTTAAPAYTTAQSSPLSLDTAGNLRVNVVTGGGSGGTSAADNAAFTAGTTLQSLAGCEATASPAAALTAGHQGAAGCSLNREMWIDTGTGSNLYGVLSASIPAGTNLIGKFGIDQTTPGTTNAVNVTNTNANGSAVSASSQPVVIASDQAAVAVKGGAASGSAITGNPVPVAGTDGTNARTLLMSTTGQPHIICDSGCSGSGGTSATDAATFTAGTSVMTPTGCEFVSGGATAITTGHMSMVGCTAARAQFTDKSSVSGTALGAVVSNLGTLAGGTPAVENVNAYIVGGAGSGGTAGADAATWTAGTTNQTPIGCEFTTGGATAIVTAHMGTVGCTAARAQLTDKSSVGGTALSAATSAYGTAPTGTTVEGVNAFVTNTNANGSAVSASSSPVVIASDQVAIAVKAASGAFASGSIASGALASGSIASGAAVSGSFVAGSIADLAHGQGTMAASVPVAIASNQSTLPANTAQVNGVTTLTGTGAVGTGAQRVAVGTDTATIAGSAPSIVLNVAPQAITTGGGSQTGNIVANNTTAVVVKSGAATLYSVQLAGLGSAPAYLKLYNATSATCGSGTPVARYMIPAASTAANGAGSNIDFGAVGVAYGTGLTYCVTTGIGDADTSAPAASTFLVNLVWK